MFFSYFWKLEKLQFLVFIFKNLQINLYSLLPKNMWNVIYVEF